MFKKMAIIVTTFPILVGVPCFAQDVGVPIWLEASTYAIKDDPYNTEIAECAHYSADKFYSDLHDYAHGYYPSIIVERDNDRKESAVTYNNFISSREHQWSEFVYVIAHGGVCHVDLYDCDNVYLSEMYFSNYTKWIFVNSCDFLQQSYSDLLPTMQTFFSHGAHALFGYASKSYWAWKWYRCGFLGTKWCQECLDRYMYDDFFIRWIVNQNNFWDSYVQAAVRQYNETGHAHEIVLWSSSAYSSTLGRYIWGYDEKITLAYRYSMNTDNGLIRLSAIVPAGGSPDY
jgi:hypothetical protein